MTNFILFFSYNIDVQIGVIIEGIVPMQQKVIFVYVMQVLLVMIVV